MGLYSQKPAGISSRTSHLACTHVKRKMIPFLNRRMKPTPSPRLCQMDGEIETKYMATAFSKCCVNLISFNIGHVWHFKWILEMRRRCRQTGSNFNAYSTLASKETGRHTRRNSTSRNQSRSSSASCSYRPPSIHRSVAVWPAIHHHWLCNMGAKSAELQKEMAANYKTSRNTSYSSSRGVVHGLLSSACAQLLHSDSMK